MKPTEISTLGTWHGVRERCRATVSKPDIPCAVSTEFKRKILLAEHNPIRHMHICWKWEGIKSWIATHFARHVMMDKYISTQRNDRTGVDRNKAPQDTPVIMMCDANLQALIDMMRKRLCGMAHAETRQYAEDLKDSIAIIDPEVAFVLQKNCVYRAGCPEMKTCGWYKQFVEKYKDENLLDIQRRYECADKEFYEKRARNK